MDNHLTPNDQEIQAAFFTSININPPQETHDPKNRPRFKIPIVHPQFRHEQVRPKTYDPVVVSLGPYHHGKPELSHVETYKTKMMDQFISWSNCKDRFFFYNIILEHIKEIRDCYEEEVIEKYDDHALASMILHDACFIFICIILQTCVGMPSSGSTLDHFRGAGFSLVIRDMHLLENQIPLWIIKFLVCLQSDQGRSMWDEMLAIYIVISIQGVDVDPETFPWVTGEEQEPVHLLAAIRRYKAIPVEALCKLRPASATKSLKVVLETAYRYLNYRFRSTTNLREKGIQVVSVSNSLSDKETIESSIISFTSHSVYGRLQLPRLILTNDFFSLHSNLIAYEMSPYCTDGMFYVTSYLNFIKSLIESPNDAKILREDGVLFSNIGSDDEVVKMIKDLNTLGIDNWDAFSELKRSINQHCSSKRKTWMADLTHTYFGSPWTVIGVFAAFCLFVLTFIQTFFTIHPAN